MNTCCLIDGCGRWAHARSLCHKHYQQWLRARIAVRNRAVILSGNDITRDRKW